MEYRPYYLAREWVKSGHHVGIVAASIAHVRTVNPVVTTPLTIEKIDGIEYVWLATPKYKENGVSRLINILYFLYRLFRYSKILSKRFHPDFVIASSTYPLDIFAAKRIASLSGAKLVFEVHDLWPLSPIELGGMSPKHPFILFVQYAENFAYRHADFVFSLLSAAKEYMVSHGMKESKFVHIPNGVSPDEWNRTALPLDHSLEKAILDIRSQFQFTVAYVGTHNLANDLDTLIEAAAILKEEKVAVLLVGQGPEKERLRTRVANEMLSNVFFFDPVPKACIRDLLSRVDALYFGLQNKPMYRFGISPNKLFDYMMAAKPIVMAAAAPNDIVSVCNCGITVNPGEPHSVAEALRRIMAMSQVQRREMGLRGRSYVMKNHDYSVLAEKFLASLQPRPVRHPVLPTQIVPTEGRLIALIVEDEESFLQALTMTLQSADRFTAVPCLTGEDALEALKTSRFDVVILDVTLPGISGLNVLQWMNEQKMDTPVIMLTGTGSEYMAAETMKLGAYDYVAKGDFDKDHFPIVVSGVVERYLFKKSKQREETKGRRREASLKVLGDSISSLAEVANNALARASLLGEEFQQSLQPMLTPESRELFGNYQGLIKQELDLIIGVTKSMLELMQSMYSRYETIQNVPEAEKDTLEKAKETQHKNSGNAVVAPLQSSPHS